MATAPKPEPVALADYRPLPQSKARHDGWTARGVRLTFNA